MAEVWKQFEGEVVDGKLLLQEYLGGDDSQGVFLTAFGEPEPRRAAIKLIREDPHGNKRRLQHWKLAEKLDHPHLMKVFASGRAELRGEAMLYVVMEHAEESLSEVIPHRALTAAEAREMLEPTLGALGYLHSEGFVHGHLKPSNILAVDGRLRISSDRLCRTGDQDPEKPDAYAPPEMDLEGFSPPGDVWSLGMTLVEALTQKRAVWEGTGPEEPVLPDTIPEPFLEIAKNCLRRNPRSRWRVADMEKKLRQSTPAAAEPKREERQVAPKRLIFVLSAVLTVILALVLFGPRIFNQVESSGGVPPEPPVTQPKPEQKAAAPVTPPAAESAAPPVTKPAEPPVVPAPVQVKPQEPAAAASDSGSSVRAIQKAMPEVSSKARSSIQGRVRVTVRVKVDASGRVVDAQVESAGPSRYFADAAVQAARKWRFPAGDGEKSWDLQFIFLRAETKVTPVRVGG